MRFLWKGRVIAFYSKNSTRLFTADILGGGDTDAAGYKPRDVCVSKLEVQKLARMPVNLQYLYSELL